jgi:hypothetical protein
MSKSRLKYRSNLEQSFRLVLAVFVALFCMFTVAAGIVTGEFAVVILLVAIFSIAMLFVILGYRWLRRAIPDPKPSDSEASNDY